MVLSRFLYVLLSLFLLSVAGSGCLPKTTLPPEPPRPPESAQGLLRQAEMAWQARNFPESSRIYGRLAWDPPGGLDLRLLPAIRERHVQSLLQSGEFGQAEAALQRWAGLDPQVREGWPWHEFLVRAQHGQGRQTEAVNHLRGLMRQPDAPRQLRFNAGLRLAELHGQARAYAPMVETLTESFSLAPDQESRAQLEHAAMRIARGLDAASLESLLQSVAGEEQWVFPFPVFFWEDQRRTATRDPSAWPIVRGSLGRLLQRGDWADRDVLVHELEQLEMSLGRPGACLGLVLPLDGPLAEIGWKVLHGAQAGRNQLYLDGLEVRLEIFNAQSPDLEGMLLELGSECTVVGGPMQRETWERIRDAGLHRERIFFTFLPSLGADEEGRLAWRFFSSPRDQVRALADLSVQTLGIQSNAVLYPEDRFGRHMMELFSQEVTAQGGVILKTQGYSPTEHGTWGQSVASLLGVQAQQRRGREESVKLPEPGFQAVFIPDSLTQAEMLLPQLFYYDEQRLLILGPELWSQVWNRRTAQLETQYFRLAVMPGAWWAENPAQAARTLVRMAEESGSAADFWMALGYDFVRWAAVQSRLFAAREGRSPNPALAQAGRFDWSIAPLHWDEDGVARQNVFLFQPTSTGLSILDTGMLRNSLERIRFLHQR